VRKYFAKWIPSELIELNSFFAPWTKEDVVGTSLALFDENIREGFEVLKGADKDEKDREIQIGLHEKSFCKTICSVISHPYAQSIAESNLQNIKAVIQDSLISRSFEMTLFNLFLISEDAKWNHAYGVNALKAENIPAHMLQTFDEIIGMYKKYPRQTSHGSVIIKNLFTTIEEMFRSRLDYLRNMNKEQYRDIAMSIAKWSIESSSHSIYFCTSDLSSVVDTLINLCGPKNVKAYIKHFFTLYEKVSALAFQKYMDYLVMCNKLRATLDGDRCPAVNWKETDEEKISQMHDEVMVLYNQVSDEAMIANTKEKFEKVSKKWDDYDYKENKFSVIMPENVLDILRESNELSHCVKSYIDPVLEGKTNIFFIRRTSDLAKPFFTLEVRNNEVRQCHGFANKNIDTEEGLEDFLTRYCKEKNINFNKKDVIRVLGA
jgi:hypothetical protein